MKRIVFSAAVCSVFVAGLVAAAAGAARTNAATPAPKITLTLPKQVVVGKTVQAKGTASGYEGAATVSLRGRQGSTATRLGRGRFKSGGYHLTFTAPVTPGTLTVQAALTIGGRTVASSPSLKLTVVAAETTPPPTNPPTPPVPPTPPTPPTEPEPPASTNSYWGAWIGPQFTGQAAPGDMHAVTDFEALAKKPLSLLETFSSFANCNQSGCKEFVPFPRAELEKIRGYGAIPLFTWASEASSGQLEQPEFELSDVAAGNYDKYIREWATAAKSWGHPFFLRFDWEMNGNWYPWSESLEDNSPGDYVAAWRHVHQIFAEVGATNAAWTWCPYIDPNNKLIDLHELYPGDAYVDWTCLDGYNHGSHTNPAGKFKSFSELFGPSYREISGEIAPSKPMLIGEVASTETGGSKAEWIEGMFSALPTEFPAVRGLMWFDYEYEGNDWAIETSDAATEAFADGIADPRYLGNSFAAATAPISPP